MSIVQIPLNHGKVALVDSEDAPIVEQFRWYVAQSRHTTYASRVGRIDGNLRTVYMHRLIMNAPVGMMVDHIDGDGLNNSRANLRICSGSENGHNRRRIDSRNKSGYVGVFYNPENRCWNACVTVDYKARYVGSFGTAEDAAIERDKVAFALRGEFAQLNFPDRVVDGIYRVQENINRGSRNPNASEMTTERVSEIEQRLRDGGSIRSVAREMQHSSATVHRIAHNRHRLQSEVHPC